MGSAKSRKRKSTDDNRSRKKAKETKKAPPKPTKVEYQAQIQCSLKPFKNLEDPYVEFDCYTDQTTAEERISIFKSAFFFAGRTAAFSVKNGEDGAEDLPIDLDDEETTGWENLSAVYETDPGDGEVGFRFKSPIQIANWLADIDRREYEAGTNIPLLRYSVGTDSGQNMSAFVHAWHIE